MIGEMKDWVEPDFWSYVDSFIGFGAAAPGVTPLTEL
jgi:hypothetical protein